MYQLRLMQPGGNCFTSCRTGASEAIRRQAPKVIKPVTIRFVIAGIRDPERHRRCAVLDRTSGLVRLQ